MMHPSAMRSLNILSIMAWKVAGKLHMPKNMMVGSKFFVGFEGSFPFVAFLDSNIIVSPLYVKLCE